jgi:hemolysin activation/secretion protein
MYLGSRVQNLWKPGISLLERNNESLGQKSGHPRSECRDKLVCQPGRPNRRTALQNAVRTFAALAWLGLVFPALQMAHAATPADAAAQQQEQIQQRQQEQLRRDLENARRAVPPSGANLRAAPEAPAVTPKGACHEIREIEILNSPHLRDSARAMINQRFAGQCLGVSEITEILGLITKDYVEQGYVTARAYLPAQDLTQGKLTIEVVEGRISKFKIDDNGANSVPVGSIFPGREGKVLNLRDLEQGIDQINQLRSNNARLEIVPGETPGDSSVVVHNEPTRPVHLLASYDNQGQAGTGAQEASATVSFDNLAKLGEQLSVTGRSSFFSADDHSTKSGGVDLWIPYGYNSWTASYLASSYRNLLVLPSGSGYLANGDTHIGTVGWNRVMYRDDVGNFSIGASLSSKGTNNFLAGSLLEVNSPTLTPLDLKTAYSRVLRSGGLFHGSLDYTHGLTIFGATHDSNLASSYQPHAQYDKLSADLQLNRPFDAVGQHWSYDSELALQKALGRGLYASEKMLIGSFYTVRGYYNNSLSGDNGLYWRNTVSLLRQVHIGDQAVDARFYTGLDVGRVTNLDDALASGNLSGGTIGVKGQWKGVTCDLFWSTPISKPVTMTREASHLWFQITAAI